jgi:CIC family chloride channel protein
MQRQITSVQASLSIQEFTSTLSPHYRHEVFPVLEEHKLLGTVSLWSLAQVPPEKWNTTKVRDLTDHRAQKISPDCGVMETLRLLTNEHQQAMLLVVSAAGHLEGIVTKSDILQALTIRRDHTQGTSYETEAKDYIAAS